MQQIPVLDHEQHDEPVGDAQQSALQVAVGVGGGRQRLAQGDVRWVRDEPGPQLLQGGGDAMLQVQQGAGAAAGTGW